MNLLQSFILGILQGLTEFLPVSSSGHIELGKAVLGVEGGETLTYTVVVHGATVLSTIVVFRKDLMQLIQGLLAFKWNDELKYCLFIVVSMLPVVVVGLLWKEQLEAMFEENVVFVGWMLLVTSVLLGITFFSKSNKKEIGWYSALITGIAQAIAVIPGISRSGSTIATALLLGIDREKAARFSFLMVLPPIIGANIKDMMDSDHTVGSVGIMPLVVGFVTAFIVGVLACRLMIRIVKRGKLIWFACYCLVVGLAALLWGYMA